MIYLACYLILILENNLAKELFKHKYYDIVKSDITYSIYDYHDIDKWLTTGKLTRVLRINKYIYIYMYCLFRYIVKSTNEFKVKNIILITLYKTVQFI